MPKPKIKAPQPEQEDPQVSSEQQSQISSEDDDAALLTSKVEEKLLSTFAKIKLKHPSIYQNKQTLYQDDDFQSEQNQKQKKKTNGKSKYTYDDLMREGGEMEDENLPPVIEEKNAKEKFKNKLSQNIEKINKDQDDLFTVKKKIGTEKQQQQQLGEKDKLRDLTKNFDKQSKKLIKKMWKSQQLDQTDLFLKQYILNKKWLSSKLNKKQNEKMKQIDEEDQERSLQMDKYEAEYNFRFEQPGGTTITQYPRQVDNTLRQKTQTRRQKRKKRQEKKKQQEEQLRKEAQLKKNQLKKQILQKLVPEEQEQQDQVQHDWFFCDDCCKGFEQGQSMWQCNECQDYMLCDQCNQLIIHKHELINGIVPEGYGAPPTGENKVKQLQPCTICRRRITPNQKSYQYTDRNYIVNAMCEMCYDKSGLDIKKKYRLVEPKEVNYEELLDQDPEKVKELTNIKQIQELVDQYMKNEFEDVISGGIKTKFRYIQVKPESYGLSDEQILFGDDKQLNKYVSVKKLAPYYEENMKLRNSIFNKKIKGIKRSVKYNKALLDKAPGKIAKLRHVAKRKNRAESVRKRLEKRLKIVNISNKDAERNHFVTKSRLLSYGIANQQDQQ